MLWDSIDEAPIPAAPINMLERPLSKDLLSHAGQSDVVLTIAVGDAESLYECVDRFAPFFS